MKKWLIAAATALILVAIAGVSWVFFRGESQLAKVAALQEQVFGEAGRELPAEQRDQLRQALREQYEELSPEQRDQLRRNRGQQFMDRMDERLTEFFSLPEEERVAFLDQEIDRSEQRRREREQRRAEGGDGERRGRDRAGGGGGGRPEGRDRPRDNSDEGRRQRRRERLDRTSPEQRARFIAYREAMQQRRKERGLPESSGRGGFGGRPGR